MSQLFGLLVWVAIVGLVVNWKKPQVIDKLVPDIKNRKRVVPLLVVALIGFSVLAGATSKKTTTEPANDNKQVAQTDSSSTPAESPKPQSIDDKLKEFAAKIKASKEDTLEVSYDAKTKVALVTYSPKAFWDQNALLKDAWRGFVSFGEKSFALDEVDVIKVVYRIEFTDTYGKKEVEDAIRISMKKEEFKKFEWKNLIGQNISLKLYESCIEYYVHPAITKSIDPSKVKLYLF